MWREWMHKRLLQGNDPASLLIRLRSPGNKNTLDDVARAWGKGYWSLPWTRLRMFHLYDKGIPEGQSQQVANLFTRMKVVRAHPGLPANWRDVLCISQQRDKPSTRLLDESDFERVMAANVALGASPLAYKLAYYCGILPSSLRRARVEDFHRIGGKYMFYERGRLLTIPDHLIEEFEAHVQWVMTNRSANRNYRSPTLFVEREIRNIAKYPEITATLAGLKAIRH